MFRNWNKNKSLVLFGTLIGVVTLFHGTISAVIVDQTREALRFPKHPEEQKENLAPPDSIYIVPLKLDFDEFVTTADWNKGIYYYQAFRLNQGDFLFHYLITKDGEIIQGNEKGEEQRFAIKDSQERPVIIAYLPGDDESDFTPVARNTISTLVIDIANRNRIKLENVSVKSLNYQVTDRQQIVAVTDIIAGRWDRSLKGMVEEMASLYDPAKFKFELEVTSVKSPEKPANYKEQVVADITIKNNSSISLYEGTDFEPLMTKEGAEEFSKFFINGVWLGPKQAKVMTEGSSIRPGESKTFQVKIGIPLYEGKQTEKFALVNILGEKYAKSEFDLEVTVNDIKEEIVESTSTPVGYLNVRESANASSRAVTRISPGQRFLVLERQGSWVKVDTGENGQGWISAQYTKVI